ncbi:hypothetical protein [Streptomyces kronopolitis]|uniref:hypothetical protein n=1 Tax=Streptomyces kronopolitis TaxID=1612435 RepID=UPI003424E461
MNSPTDEQPEYARQGPALQKSTLARDVVRDRVGKVMDYMLGLYYLRPLEGGKEWSAEHHELTPIPLSEAPRGPVAEVNHRHRCSDQ